MNYKIDYIKRKKKYIKDSDKSTIKEIYLIRHGETEWDKLDKSQGDENSIPLNDTGREQAKKTGKYLLDYRMKKKDFDCIISSPMKQTVETADIISQVIGYQDKIINEKLLKETRKGLYAGVKNGSLLCSQVKKIIWKKKISDPILSYQFDVISYINNELDLDMETKKEQYKRTDKIIKLIELLDYKKIIIVSHGDILKSLIERIFHIHSVPTGRLSNNKTSWISYIKYKKGQYYLVSPPNNEHLSIYKE